MLGERTCADCKRSFYEQGDRSVGIPDGWICGIPEMCRQSNNSDQRRRNDFKGCHPIRRNIFKKLEDIDWDWQRAPEICGQFEPRMIAHCGYCKKAMNVPVYSWKIWASGVYDPIPVCSEECRSTLDFLAV